MDEYSTVDYYINRIFNNIQFVVISGVSISILYLFKRRRLSGRRVGTIAMWSIRCIVALSTIHMYDSLSDAFIASAYLLMSGYELSNSWLNGYMMARIIITCVAITTLVAAAPQTENFGGLLNLHRPISFRLLSPSSPKLLPKAFDLYHKLFASLAVSIAISMFALRWQKQLNL
jgi:hypothetical protein